MTFIRVAGRNAFSTQVILTLTLLLDLFDFPPLCPTGQASSSRNSRVYQLLCFTELVFQPCGSGNGSGMRMIEKKKCPDSARLWIY